MYSTNLVRRRLTPCLQSGWNWEVNDDEIWVGWDGKGAAPDPKNLNAEEPEGWDEDFT